MTNYRAGIWRAAALCVVGALAMTACGDSQQVASTSEPAAPAISSTSPSASATPTGSGETLAVYYVGKTERGLRLYREFAAASGGDPVTDAVRMMFAGKAQDADYSSLWPSTTSLRGVNRDGSTEVVDLTAAPEGSRTAAEATMALQQLVHTVTAADRSVTAVRLLAAGQPLGQVWGTKVGTTLTRAPQLAVLAPIWLDTPADGSTTGRTVKIGGAATAYEGTVRWAALRDGKVVKEGFATASAGAPDRGTWSAVVDLEPGAYVIRAYEESAEDGSALFVDDKHVTVG